MQFFSNLRANLLDSKERVPGSFPIVKKQITRVNKMDILTFISFSVKVYQDLSSPLLKNFCVINPFIMHSFFYIKLKSL